jgi:hypothetical protein
MNSDLVVLHLDSIHTDYHHFAPTRTMLAPWSVWFNGGYHAFADPEAFTAALASHSQVFVLLHETDRLRVANPIAERISKDPNCHVILYSGNWLDWGTCKRDNVLRIVGEGLPADLFNQQWSAMPWDHISGNARPVCWLASKHLSFSEVAQPMRKWTRNALDQFGENVTHAADFDRCLRQRLRNGVLVHHLNSDGAHPLSLADRRFHLLEDGDNLWLMHALAQNCQWPTIATRIEKALDVLAALLRANRLQDGDHPHWHSACVALEDLINEDPEPATPCPNALS